MNNQGEVLGPEKMDTLEQRRTRDNKAAEESAQKASLMYDESLSTMTQNLLGAGVDDRGVENESAAKEMDEEFEWKPWFE